jgi:cytochrome P450
MDSSLEAIDVSDPAIYQQDTWRPLFARLRAEDPVHYCPRSPYGAYWSITKYDDIFRIELDHKTFSSSSEVGGIQITDQPAGHETYNFIRMDPPAHTAQRKIVSPIAAPSHLVNLESVVRERTAWILDNLPRGETFDWVDLVSSELTSMMLATLFDFPFDDRRKLTYWSDVSIANVSSPDAIIKSDDERAEELGRMAAYFRVLWDDRAAKPPKFDLVSMLAHGEATRNLSPREFIGTMGLLIVGGTDTTRNSMTAGLLALQEHPNEYRKLREKPELVPSLVSEIIRYHSPVLHMRRTAQADTELAGKKIAKGDKVVLWYISGNRDESKIEQADAFVIDRPKPRQHLAFGAGVHRCVGDRLAEMQLRVLWEEILKRSLDFEVVSPPKRIYSNFIRGLQSLEVRICG